jgi:cobalt-zinc-cadmium efflux system protein
MGHNHSHNHHNSKNVKGAFFINLAFTIIELIGGLMTNSMAILSDALHDLGDSISLGLSWFMANYSQKGRSRSFTYGYGRFSLLAAFINSLVLISGSVIILTQAIPRLLNPVQPDAKGMLWLAIIGIVFNGAAIFRLKGSSSLNEKVVRLHLLEDVLGWVVVLIGSIVMMFYDVPILDPLLSIGVALFIMFNVAKNLYQTGRIFLQAKPQDIDMEGVIEQLQQIDGIQDIHDVHLWTLDGEYYIMTVHAVVADNTPMSEAIRLKRQIRERSHKREIEHVTVELEFAHEECGLQEH